MELEYLLYPCEGLEIRQRGKRPTLSGRFPYGRLATKRDRGSTRKETIMPLAFDFAIKDQTREISLLYGHAFDKPLGSRLRGSLIVRNDKDGVEFEATLPDPAEQPSWVRDAMLAVQGGLVHGVSPGFRVPPLGVVDNAESLIEEVGNPGVFIRQINHAVLAELSLVSRPAYPDTGVEIRSAGAHPIDFMRLL